MTITVPQPFNRSRISTIAGAAALYLAFAPAAYAGQVEIVDAQANASGGDLYSFSVTLRHADTGWDHYANEWDIRAPDGTVLGTRVLVHPHVNEQPFTRSLSGVSIPKDLKSVVVRAKDNVHGLSPQEYILSLPER